jgi:predicted ATPase
MPEDDRRTPVTIVTGFLGAGKTTLSESRHPRTRLALCRTRCYLTTIPFPRPPVRQ